MSDRLNSTRLLAASLAAVVFTALIFVTWPGLDLTVAAWFALGEGRFAGQTRLGDTLRILLELVPFGLLIGLVALHTARRSGWRLRWAPNRAGVIFLALSLALGPGLLTNVLLKNNSHRPRPAQVTDFGGAWAFRPFYRFDGACVHNCSFVSGEGSIGFWTLAPALLAPPPVRVVALVGALVFGAATGLLRIAFGGHFLSDTLFAGLFTWLVILGCWRLVARTMGQIPGGSA